MLSGVMEKVMLLKNILRMQLVLHHNHSPGMNVTGKSTSEKFLISDKYYLISTTYP